MIRESIDVDVLEYIRTRVENNTVRAIFKLSVFVYFEIQW